MKTPEIARHLRMGERTVREWLKQGTFPEAKKRRVAGKAPLMPLHALCFHALKRGKETVWRCGEQSRNKATREEARTVYRYLETLKQAEGKRIGQSTAHPEVCSQCGTLARMSRDPESLDEVEREDLAAFCQVSSALKKAYDLVQDCLSMVLQQRGISTGYVVRAGRKL